MKKIFIFIISLVICMLLPVCVSSAKADEEKKNTEVSKVPENLRNRDYIIKNYHMDIDITEENVYVIKETIHAYFNVEKHGIIRNIPQKNNVKRNDGTSYRVFAKIKNIYVDNIFDVDRNGDSCDIKIGSENKTITGDQIYTISYTYDLGNDLTQKYDEVYFNIIGTGWDVPIENVTFNIKMPKDFDEEKIGFSVGSKGTIGYGKGSNSEAIRYEIENNEIKGTLVDYLAPYEGITIRTELPEGYFIKRSITEDKINYLIYIIPICGFIIAFVLWFMYGKDNKVEWKLEYYPPEGYNSLQVAYIYKGQISDKDVVSLLIYLANKGYIRIHETQKKYPWDNDTVELYKLKEYDGNDYCERRFMNGLFVYSNAVRLSQLQNKFYKVIKEIKEYITSKENRDCYFEGSNRSKSVIVGLFMAVSILSLIIIPARDAVGTEGIGDMLFTLAFLMVFVFVGLLKGLGTLFRIIWLGFCSLFIYATLSVYSIIDIVLYEKFYTVAWGIGIVCVVGMILCIKYMPKRTPLGTELYGKIKGYKKYLEQSNTRDVEQMMSYNATYSHDAIAYAYVLGVYKMLFKKYEILGLNSPGWYESCYNDGSLYRFRRLMNHTMDRATSTLSSSPSSSGGSGGGSSGGGCGGGGGSSW